MAESVTLHTEHMIDELEQLIRIGLFTKQETEYVLEVFSRNYFFYLLYFLVLSLEKEKNLNIKQKELEKKNRISCSILIMRLSYLRK